MLRFTQNRRAGLQTGSIQFGRHFLAHLLWWHNGQAVRGLWLYQCVYCVVESFMTDVWRCLLSNVPYGRTISYGELAQLSGRGRASRAVGQAMRRNCISLLIPCHRVICSNGQTLCRRTAGFFERLAADTGKIPHAENSVGGNLFCGVIPITFCFRHKSFYNSWPRLLFGPHFSPAQM